MGTWWDSIVVDLVWPCFVDALPDRDWDHSVTETTSLPRKCGAQSVALWHRLDLPSLHVRSYGNRPGALI
jgi:hypothetical protein